MPAELGGKSQTTQWVTTFVGRSGSGASGSWTMSAKLLVLGGAPLHTSGGDRFCPSHEYLAGIAASGANPGDESVSFTCAVLLLPKPLLTRLSAGRALATVP